MWSVVHFWKPSLGLFGRSAEPSGLVGWLDEEKMQLGEAQTDGEDSVPLGQQKSWSFFEAWSLEKQSFQKLPEVVNF